MRAVPENHVSFLGRKIMPSAFRLPRTRWLYFFALPLQMTLATSMISGSLGKLCLHFNNFAFFFVLSRHAVNGTRLPSLFSLWWW